MRDGGCYLNASRRVDKHPDWRYVEGVAIGDRDFWVDHAWVVDPHGIVIETTWLDLGHIYFGVAVPIEVVNRKIIETGLAGPVLSEDMVADLKSRLHETIAEAGRL